MVEINNQTSLIDTVGYDTDNKIGGRGLDMQLRSEDASRGPCHVANKSRAPRERPRVVEPPFVTE
jgi:hypothetical protein